MTTVQIFAKSKHSLTTYINAFSRIKMQLVFLLTQGLKELQIDSFQVGNKAKIEKLIYQHNGLKC